MNFRLTIFNILTFSLFIVLFFSSCNSTKHLSENQYLLRKNSINLYITKKVICELNTLVGNDTIVQKLQEKTAIEYTVHLMNGSMPRYMLRNIYWSIRYHIKAFIH